MPRVTRILALLAVLAVGTVPVQASSTPNIAGLVSGVELCAQSMCGSAIFVGVFYGRVGFLPRALGTIAVAVHHGPLPETVGQCTPITDGLWSLWVGLRKFQGEVSGGLCYQGNNRFGVHVDMTLDQGGTGTMNFDGILDHNPFPPTIQGFITQ